MTPKTQTLPQESSKGSDEKMNQSHKQGKEQAAKSKAINTESDHAEDVAMSWKRSSMYMPQGLIVS
jgi:hypothetical protein